MKVKLRAFSDLSPLKTEAKLERQFPVAMEFGVNQLIE